MAWNRNLIIPLGLNVLMVVLIATLLLYINNWFIVFPVTINTIGILINTHTAFTIGRTTVYKENIKEMEEIRDLAVMALGHRAEGASWHGPE